jgi:CubicO group peptidase (beta-lactamase class C family)
LGGSLTPGITAASNVAVGHSKKITRFVVLILALSLPQSLAAQTHGIERFITSYATKNNFSGSILIQKNGRAIYAKSFGFSNLKFSVPNTNQTNYKIASITKLFTAVLILQLLEQGRIDLNSTIHTYLPDYTGAGSDKVTVVQLLTHTSGIENSDKVKTAKDAIEGGLPVYQAPYSSDELIRKFCSGPLVNIPGKVFDYNNADYIILGKIIERIYGDTYEGVLTKKIFRPLKLMNTGMLHQSDIVPRLADTYFFRDDLKRLANDLPVYPENWYAAGAMYSTANDLLKFSDALFNKKFLKPETLALMLKPGLDDYGFGVWVYKMKIGNDRPTIVKRPGAIMGAQSMLFHVLEQNVTIIILSNTDAVSLDDFAADISKRI